MLGLGLIQVINLFLIFHCNEQPLLSLDLFYFSTFNLRLSILTDTTTPTTATPLYGRRFSVRATRHRRHGQKNARGVRQNSDGGGDGPTWVWFGDGRVGEMRGNRDGDSGGRGGVPGGVLKRPSCVCRYSLYRGRKTIEKQTANVKSL